MSWYRTLGIAALALFFVAGCASSQQKQRREQRDKAVQNAKLYCEFLNGEQFPDLDVALNLAIAQKCDSEKALSLTSYKTPSEIPGIMFCCSVAASKANMAPAATAKAEPAAKVKADKPAAKPAADKAAGEQPQDDELE